MPSNQSLASPKLARELIGALELRAARARRQAMTVAAALSEAEASASAAREALEQAELRHAAEEQAARTAIEAAETVRIDDLLTLERQTLAARKEREGLAKAASAADARRAQVAQAAAETAAQAVAAEKRVEKVRIAIDRETEVEQLKGLRALDAEADG